MNFPFHLLNIKEKRLKEDMKNKKILIFLFLLIITLTACSKSGLGALTQSSNNITGVLTFDPDPFEVMSPVTLSLQLTDAAGQPINDAQVSYDLTMPAMKMPAKSTPGDIPGRRTLYSPDHFFNVRGVAGGCDRRPGQ